MTKRHLRNVAAWAVIGGFLVLVAWRFVPFDVRYALVGPRISSAEYRAHLLERVELARNWSGDCPDWSRLTSFPYDPTLFTRTYEPVSAAARLGDADAIWCALSTSNVPEESHPEIGARVDYDLLLFARLLGVDPARVDERIRELEPYLSEQDRVWAKDAAEAMKRDLDWVIAQGLLDE